MFCLLCGLCCSIGQFPMFFAGLAMTNALSRNDHALSQCSKDSIVASFLSLLSSPCVSSDNNLPSDPTQTVLPTDYPCHILCHLSSIFPCLFPVIYFVLPPINPNFCALIFRLSSVIYLQLYHPLSPPFIPSHLQTRSKFYPQFFPV